MRRTRLVVALGLLLFGTTFLWFTPAFTGTVPPPGGPVWVLIQVLALLTVLVFTGAGWAVYRGSTWWRAAAITGSILAATLMLLWWIAVSMIPAVPAVPGVLTTIGLHWAGVLVVLVLALLAPGADRPLGAGLHAPPRQDPGR